MCDAVPAGTPELRDGPVRVAKVTLHLRPVPVHVAAVVGVYHDRP